MNDNIIKGLNKSFNELTANYISFCSKNLPKDNEDFISRKKGNISEKNQKMNIQESPVHKENKGKVEKSVKFDLSHSSKNESPKNKINPKIEKMIKNINNI